MLEKNLEAKCCNIAFSIGINNIKLTALSNRGWPDRIFFIGSGVLWFVEFKRKGLKTRINQDNIIYFLKNNGYNVDIVDSYDDFLDKLKSIVSIKRHSKKNGTV